MSQPDKGRLIVWSTRLSRRCDKRPLRPNHLVPGALTRSSATTDSSTLADSLTR
jgi:hypothetical protein